MGRQPIKLPNYGWLDNLEIDKVQNKILVLEENKIQIKFLNMFFVEYFRLVLWTQGLSSNDDIFHS